MAIVLRYAARTDIGLGRYTNNQDSGYAGPHLLAVADGMGGHAGGDIASSIAIGELAGLDGESHGPDAVRHLQDAIARARDVVLRRAEEDPQLAGMGTTVTALLRSGRRLVLAHIGDSRAYLLRDGQISQVTHDHTFVQRLVDEGRITAEEAERHPQRSMIMRVLGDVESDGEADVSVREARAGDRWLLCSDGLSGVVSIDTLRETLSREADPAACADQLVELALRAGAPDNVTCIVADVLEADSAPTLTPQVVGSAAVDRRGASANHDETPAGRAAALTAPAAADGDEPDGPDDDEAPGRRRHWLRAALVLLVVGLLAGGGYAAYAWSQQQYYVGAASDDVAIYRGLTQDVGPVRLSAVYEPQEIPVDTLPQVWQERVDAGIVAEDLTDARRIVRDLLLRSELCEPVAVAAPSPTSDPATGATTSPTTGPTATGPTTGPPTDSTASTPSATPRPTTTLRPECEEAGR